MKNLSLRLRLSFILLSLFIITSLIATSISMYKTKESLTELFDTQLYYFAQRVSTSNIDILLDSSSSDFIKDESKIVEKYMSVDDDALTFSIFSIKGDILYTDGEDSKYFSFNHLILNNNEGILFEENKKFRIIWMLSSDKKFVVVVAQEKEFINDLILDILEDLIYPWLFILPFLIISLLVLITKELKPLNKLSKTLSLKDANDNLTLDENTTKELKPVVKSLNSLFFKIKTMIDKERRFISNAAHELKTPLAALKIQAEVAKLSIDDKESLLKSLDNIEIGVNRATRLIEQLLALSRIESINEFDNLSLINWTEIINSNLKELEFKAKEKNISINFLHTHHINTLQAEPIILSLLVRNLLDNAIKYNENNTNIRIELEKNHLIIQDNGKGINPLILKNIGERFVRPAGEKQIGSGLGFSIVQQIGKLHNLRLNFENIIPNGFKITIYW